MINKNHQSDLLDQIKHLERLKLAERENDKKEFEDCLDAEVEFQEKLQQVSEWELENKRVNISLRFKTMRSFIIIPELMWKFFPSI